MTYKFCALWRRYKSHKVSAIIASAIGTALMPTQGSCLPFVLIVVGLFLISTVLPGTKMLDVGLSAILTLRSCPVDIPPNVPPEKLLKKPLGVISSLASYPF